MRVRHVRRFFRGLAVAIALAGVIGSVAAWPAVPAAGSTAAVAAAASADLDQCANGPQNAHAPCLNGTLDGTNYSDWINGNVNQAKAHWSEGQFIAYRTVVSGLSSGDHTLVLHYDTVHGGKHAIDYLGSYDTTETTSTTAGPQNRNNSNPCFDVLGTSGCATPASPPTPASTIPVPQADLAGAGTCGGASWLGTVPAQQSGSFDLFAPAGAGADFTDAHYVSQDAASGSGNCATTMSVTFDLPGTAPADGWAVVLAWGGHIASALDWGVGNSASAISGSPYHMALDTLDVRSAGSQDRSLSATAVASPPASIGTQASSTSIGEGSTLSDTARLSGSSGAVTGTVDFFVCAGTTTGCDQGKGTQVGSAGLVNGAAALTLGSSLATGNYCVGIAYVNDGKSFYSSTYSGSQANECFTVTQASAPVVDIVKTADHGSVSAGDPAGYTVTVSASGTGTALGVTMTDVLPADAGTSWSIASGATTGGWTCSIASGTLRCGGPGFSLDTGASASVHVTSLTSAATCGTVTNRARVTAANAGSADSALVPVTVNCPRIAITKAADADVASAGDQIGYTIRVSNGGAGTAHDVTLTDVLPAVTGTSWSIVDSDTSGGWSCSIGSGVLGCGGAGTGLAPGGSLSVHITSPTSAGSCGTVENTASVSTSNDGSAVAGDSVTVDCPSLTIRKAADAGSVSAGDRIGYTVTVANAGPGTARDVTVADTLPVVPGGGWSVAAGSDASCSVAGGVLSCGPAELAAGESLAVRVTSPTSGRSCGTFDNLAAFGSGNGGSGVSAVASVRVDCAGIGLVKTPDAGSVSAGDQVGYTVTATNGGAGTARDVTVTDPLPGEAGLSWAAGQVSAGWSCSVSAGTLRCGGAGTSLAAGARLSVHLTSPTTAGSCGLVVNDASAATSNAGSASASAPVDVRCPGVVITKTADAGAVSAGNRIGYTITVTNGGAGTARDVTVTDPLPARAGLSWSADSASAGWKCSVSAGTLTCGGPGTSLDPGTSLSVHIASPTSAGSCGTVENTASVTASNGGPGKSSASVTVTCGPAIATKLSKSVIAAGDGSLTDTATLTGSAGTVTGTVDFQLCAGTSAGCPQGSGTTLRSGVPLANGSATSAPFGFGLPPGRYCVGLAYRNDGKSPYPDAYSGSPAGECFIVAGPPGPVPPAIRTRVSKYVIRAGGSLRDTARLAGPLGTVTGTVDFRLCPGTSAGCPRHAGATFQSGVPLVSGSATSAAFGAGLRPGRYCVGLAYHNDRESPYANAYSGTRTGECFTVGRRPFVTTRLWRRKISAGGSVLDYARLHRVTRHVHGTVQYRYYSTLRGCEADTYAWPARPRHGHGAGTVTVHGIKVRGSRWVTFRRPGTYYWAAFYSGDARNAPAVSRCLTEVLKVRRQVRRTRGV